MAKRKKERLREERIDNEVVVDAYGPEERAMGWYYYLEGKIRFPFQAQCIAAKTISPLLKGEKAGSPAHGSRRCLLRRYARADPVARSQHGSPSVSINPNRR